MCIMSAPSMPTPALPPPPPPPAREVDPEVQRARDEARRRAAQMSGYGSTIATSGQGVVTPVANTTAKTLLGQ